MKKWIDEGEDSLWLITPAEFDKLPDGIELLSTHGVAGYKGTHCFDMETRCGVIAYGVRNPFQHKHKNLFLLFMLAN